MIKGAFRVEGFRYAGTEDRDYGQGFVRVNMLFLEMHYPRALTWQRNQLVLIRNLDNGRAAVCIFRPLAKREPDLICLEYDDRLKLGIEEKGKIYNLTFRRVGRLRSFGFYWNHPNPLVSFNFKLSVYLTLVSVALGALVSAVLF